MFFASTGFLIDPSRIPSVLGISLAAIAVAALAKVIPGILVLRRTAGIPADVAFPLASVLIPRAEISLIIAQYGVSIGITPDLLAIAMTVMIGTALLPAPILAAWQRRTAAAEAA